MRKALVVGIDHYSHGMPLAGCVNDAHAVKAILDRHGDGTVNFSVKLLTGDAGNAISRATLRAAVVELFADENDIALFYFSGHGHIDTAGGYVCATDTATGDDGLSLADVMAFANKSKSKNKIIVLDSCNSGIAAASPTAGHVSELAEGVTVLTASTADQYALEGDGGGVFTALFLDALGGAAANLMGSVTPGGVYAHIDQSLGPWDQRPIFKTNVKSFVSLRSVQPPIELAHLQRLIEFFPTPGFSFRLDSSFEPESKNPDSKKTAVFAILQKYNRVNLVVPEGAPHMYHAAINGKSCKLTVVGEHYRRLVERKLI
jgi:hypothetical protein